MRSQVEGNSIEQKSKSCRVHECDSCKEKFASPKDFIFHMENIHKLHLSKIPKFEEIIALSEK